MLRKRDFLDLDNPLLAWMLDYDAVSAVLKSLPAFKGLAQDAMEHVLDRWAVGVCGGGGRVCVCVCVGVCARARARMCGCVCVVAFRCA